MAAPIGNAGVPSVQLSPELLILNHRIMQTMHEAERMYHIGKAVDEEEAKQRQLNAILNKLTPPDFEELFEQVKSVYIDNAAVTLFGVTSQIFNKALMEPTLCETYANICSLLVDVLPCFIQGNEKITFKRLLLNMCQMEFEREQEEANQIDEKRVEARRRKLGNIRFIGELYKKRMLTERIIHECIKKLLGDNENPDEEDVEGFCVLMSTVRDTMDRPRAKVYMDAYFERIGKLSNNMKISSRVRFMLMDVIDLRRNGWQQRRKVEGPERFEDVHRDSARVRQARSSCGPAAINPSARPRIRLCCPPVPWLVLGVSLSAFACFHFFWFS